jgi:DNA ligase-4
VLNNFHPDGNDYYNLTNSIKETCKRLESLESSINDDIAIFHPIRPMLAGKRAMKFFEESSQEKEYFVETKFDGERLQVHMDNKEIKVFSRNGVDYNHVYESMLPIFRDNLKCKSCILDGEIIVLKKETLEMMPFGMNKVVALGNDSELQLCYKVFDILWVK